MKLSILRSLILCLALAPCAVSAQTFTSGSTGSYGALNPTASTTLDVPPDGIFHCTTINITSGRTVTFRRNANNTPVYLLATGNITIAGSLDVDGVTGNNVKGGEGGPGGFDGGSPASTGVPPGSGYGPGAGRGGSNSRNPDGAGSGTYSTVSSAGNSTGKGATYGSALLIPMIGGSGGGGTAGTPGGGGGGGGGGILIASTTRIDLAGNISAEGGGNIGNAGNAGSGGAIRLVAPAIAGNGTLFVRGGDSGNYGRIRIDATDRSLMNFTFFDSSVTSVGSLLLVFPSPLPRLDIIEAAGAVIPEGSGPVTMTLPFGSSPDRVIRVQARDFNAQVPITLILTPDHGTPTTYNATINNSGGNNPAAVNVNVTLPVNEQTTVHVFSK